MKSGHGTLRQIGQKEGRDRTRRSRHHPVQYLNKILERDHRAIKTACRRKIF